MVLFFRYRADIWVPLLAAGGAGDLEEDYCSVDDRSRRSTRITSLYISFLLAVKAPWEVIAIEKRKEMR